MATQEGRLLLLIDDEPAQSRLVTALAAREGWRTIVVETCEEAHEALTSKEGAQIAAVLLDQWVPGEDACDFIRNLKSAWPNLPVMMLTASTSPLLAVEAMRAGATDYLIKPIAPERLLSADPDAFIDNALDQMTGGRAVIEPEARDAYLMDPGHKKTGARLVAAAVGGVEGILVYDLDTGP